MYMCVYIYIPCHLPSVCPLSNPAKTMMGSGFCRTKATNKAIISHKSMNCKATHIFFTKSK